MECIFNKVDSQFETSQGLNYRLSILLCQDGFSFLATHAVSNKVLRITSYKLHNAGHKSEEAGGWPQSGNDYFAALQKVDLSQMSWQRVDIAVASCRISVAPYTFLEDGNASAIMSAAYTISESEQIFTEPVYDLGPVTAILAPRYISDFCASLFPGSLIHTASAVFVKGILRKYSQLIVRQVFINVYHDFFEISVIQGLRLLYLNAFRYTSPSDVLYYVIFVLEQLGFVPSEEKVTLMGEITADSTIFIQLKMYCASLNFISRPVELDFDSSFIATQMHTHFTLLNIPICV